MNVTEANSIIAEFMGVTVVDDLFIVENLEHNRYVAVAYSQCLNALVPVWEKLELNNLRLPTNCSSDRPRVHLTFIERSQTLHPINVYGMGKTIQESACLATAKYIKELKG